MHPTDVVSVAEVMDRIAELPADFQLPPKATTFAERERDRLEVAFIEECGRLDYLKMALAQSLSPKMQNFFLDLAHPEAKQFSISELARHHKITSIELAQIFRDFNHSKGMLNMMAELPEVSKDIANDAKSKRVTCPRCDGFGEIDKRDGSTMKCPECRGRGLIRKAGDLAARKLVFEAVGYTTKQALVNIDQRKYTSIESTLDDLDAIEAGS